MSLIIPYRSSFFNACSLKDFILALNTLLPFIKSFHKTISFQYTKSKNMYITLKVRTSLRDVSILISKHAEHNFAAIIFIPFANQNHCHFVNQGILLLQLGLSQRAFRFIHVSLLVHKFIKFV
jgi:hypothetical protein